MSRGLARPDAGIHSRRTTRRAMAASSHAVRSGSVAAKGDHSSRMRSTSIVIAVGGQQGLDVDLVLGPEGDHLGEDQPLGRGHADRMALRPFQGLGVGERAGVEGQDRLEPVDPDRSEREGGDVLLGRIPG